jgi:hypothetical protein
LLDPSACPRPPCAPQIQSGDTACAAYNAVKAYLLGETPQQCGADTRGGYFATCKCYAPGVPTPAPPVDAYKCHPLFKTCLQDAGSATTKHECEADCK